MSDFISRQAVIDELKKISFSHWFECGEYLSEDTREIKIISSNKALETIEALPSAQPEPQWIPVAERLPEEDHWLGGSGKQFSDNVLISITNREDEDAWSDISQTIDGEWRFELPRHCKITAWKPLPEPYRGDGNE